MLADLDLDLDLDNRLKSLELKCRFPVQHLLSGEYHSVFKGRGIEFEDVRPYEPGDDVRTMDWKVTARTGKAHIKRYIEEREQFVYLLVDVSASLFDDDSGVRRKTVTELCALISMAALNNHDRVGMILFSDQLELVLPPAKGRTQALRLMETLMTFQPQRRGTQFSVVLDLVGQMVRKRSVFFMLSDFLVADHLQGMGALAARHDVNAVHLMDRRFSVKDQESLVKIRDAESDEVSLIDLKESREGRATHQQVLRTELMNRGVNLMELAAGQDCVEALTGFFRSRQHRIDEETGG